MFKSKIASVNDRLGKRVIMADDWNGVVRQLEDEGLAEKGVFFKRIQPYKDLGGLMRKQHKLSDFSPRRLELEYYMMCKIYEAVPENTATPIGLVANRNSITGYLTEYIEGRPSYQMYDDTKDVGATVGLLEKFIDLLQRMRQSGVGHGDIHSKNFMVTDSGTIKQIDPHPCRGSLVESLRYAVRVDRWDLYSAIAKRDRYVDEAGRC